MSLGGLAFYHVNKIYEESCAKTAFSSVGSWLRSSLILLNVCEIVRSNKKNMFTRIKMSAEEGIHRGVYASVVRPGKCNKRKNIYAARRSRKL